MTKNIKNQLIKLGYQKPELREHLRPVLAHLEKTSGYLLSVPKLDPAIAENDRARRKFFRSLNQGSAFYASALTDKEIRHWAEEEGAKVQPFEGWVVTKK